MPAVRMYIFHTRDARQSSMLLESDIDISAVFAIEYTLSHRDVSIAPGA